jgi:hypothetical protein
VSEAHVNGTIYGRDEASIIDALEAMFGGYKKKEDLLFRKDGFDVAIYADDEDSLVSAVVVDKTDDEARALVREFARRLDDAGIEYVLDLEHDDGTSERLTGPSQP